MRASNRPAFGIVASPAVAVPASVAAEEVTEAGFVPRPQFRTDLDSRTEPPALTTCREAARHGDWATVAAHLPPVDADPDVLHHAIVTVAEFAVRDDTWLNAWLDGTPRDARAWCVHAEAMVRLAWELRSSGAAGTVSREQWIGFGRVLGQVPDACARTTTLAPGLASPWLTLITAAKGLGWNHDRFRQEVWAPVLSRAPRSVPAHVNALSYWLPRWQGSTELATAFLAETDSRATPGSLLTMVRLAYLFQERVPGKDSAPFYRGTELGGELDSALADLAAASPYHPYRAQMQHWLAYFLTRAGRYAEAVEQFRAIDGCIGARPWDWLADQAGSFAKLRSEAIRGG
jgi:hypothetical protein